MRNESRIIGKSGVMFSGGSKRFYVILGICAVLHSAVLLLRATGALPDGLPPWALQDRVWIALVLFWFVWPLVMALHPAHTWRPFAIVVFLSLLFLIPSGRFYYWIVEEALTAGPSPTPDKPIVKGFKDLGGGFRQVGLAEYMEGGFESVYHGEYLFFRDRKLADFSLASVAPSKRFAVYVDVESDRLLLFRARDQTVSELSNEPLTDFAWFDWDEPNGKVTVRFSSMRPPQDFLIGGDL